MGSTKRITDPDFILDFFAGPYTDTSMSECSECKQLLQRVAALEQSFEQLDSISKQAAEELSVLECVVISLIKNSTLPHGSSKTEKEIIPADQLCVKCSAPAAFLESSLIPEPGDVYCYECMLCEIAKQNKTSGPFTWWTRL